MLKWLSFLYLMTFPSFILAHDFRGAEHTHNKLSPIRWPLLNTATEAERLIIAIDAAKNPCRSELQLLRNNIENLRNSVIYWKDITSDKNALEKTLNS